MSKFLLVVVVFVLVFNPKKMPLLITNFCEIYKKYGFYKQKVFDFFHESFKQEIKVNQLQENIKKATEADELYDKKGKIYFQQD